MKSLFGTDGIRGTFGTTPLTPHDLIQLGSAVAHWALSKIEAPRILIGHDTRQSAALCKAALKTGLLQQKVALFDAGIITTPGIFHLVTKTDAYDFGIMLTASHNPYQDNGVKIFSRAHGKLSQEDEARITELYYASSSPTSFALLGSDSPVVTALTDYTKALTERFEKNLFSGIRLVIDCGNGATSSFVPAFLQSLGAKVITLAAEPNGTNINHQCGSVHPELLQATVIAEQADLGFAFDGDGDRLVAVTNKGELRDGDDLIGFLLTHPVYQLNSSVVGTVMSNQGLEDYCRSVGKELMRTPVGDKYVIAAMQKHATFIGGEPSGHLILSDFSATADALFALLRIVETVLIHKKQISEAWAPDAHSVSLGVTSLKTTLPLPSSTEHLSTKPEVSSSTEHVSAKSEDPWNLSSFTKFPQVIINCPVAKKEDLTKEPFATVIAAHKAILANGRLVVRYSGTENLLRVMVEARSQEEALAVGQTLSHQLTTALQGISA